MATINCPICKKDTILKPNTSWGAVLDGGKKCDNCGGFFKFWNNDGALTTIVGQRTFRLNGTERNY